MNLTELLHARLTDGRPFGFCPWEDGDGMLWGTLLHVAEHGIQVQQIAPNGESDGVEWYSFDEISSFDFGEDYAERLLRLGKFQATRPNFGFHEGSDEIARILRRANESGEVIAIRTSPEDSNVDVRILAVGGNWFTVQNFDDLMRPTTIETFRLSRINGVRSGSRHEEASEFLEGLNKNSPEPT